MRTVGKERDMRTMTIWRKINWQGLLGAAVLLWYGFREEPLAAVLGGIMIACDIAVNLADIRQK